MEILNLFTTELARFKIDSTQYSKQSILETIFNNYKKAPTRNNWDSASNIHHYYNDWGNSNFEKPVLDNLAPLYFSYVQKYLNTVKFIKKDLMFRIVIENITVYNGQQDMAEHEHLNGNVVLSCIHYLKVPEKHAPITFTNPLIVTQYDVPIFKKYSDCLSDGDLKNTTYFKCINLDVEEDDFIIFPSYLKHKVVKSNAPEGLRVAVVSNIILEQPVVI